MIYRLVQNNKNNYYLNSFRGHNFYLNICEMNYVCIFAIENMHVIFYNLLPIAFIFYIL